MSPMIENRDLDDAYADVILRTGVNLRKGQSLFLRVDPASRDFARIVTAHAYDLGARFVDVAYEDACLDRARIDHSGADDLDYVPGYVKAKLHEIVEEGWASMAIRGPEHPDVMDGADPGRLGRMRKAQSLARKEFMSAISSNRIAWNVCIYPTPGWAAKVLGERPGGDRSERSIWDVLAPILRLDAPDPSAAWLEQDAELKRRAGFLNDHRFDAFHFSGPGTDLTVGMSERSSFLGGRCTTASGTSFFPNIPTEEVFSTPDLRRTSGRVACTRPLYLMGALVENAWFVFEEGRVVESGASRGAEVIERFLETDPQSRFLGEVALVGVDSPIYLSGLLFHNILLDENASCHIALGNGYTDAFRDSGGLTDEELLESGCNVSLVHTDFMIGSEEVDVHGIGREGGKTIQIMEKGRFVI